MFRSDWQYNDPDSSGSDDDDPFTLSYLDASAARLPPRTMNRPADNNGDLSNTTTTQALSIARPKATGDEGEVSETHTQDPTYPPSRAAHTLSAQVPGPETTLSTDFTPSSENGRGEEPLHHKLDATKLETLLSPVQTELRRLRNTTLPPYNQHVHSKSAAQVLKERLLPVGRHIIELLRAVDGSGKGGLEMEICEYIARLYWPRGVGEVSGMEVMEMYRNALFGEAVEGDVGAKREGAWRGDGDEGEAEGEERGRGRDGVTGG